MNSAGPSTRAIVSREGKVSLPARDRRAAGIKPGSPVSVRTIDGRIVIESIDALLDDLQGRARVLMAGTDDSVDRFIADKYAEAARDEYDI